MNRKASISGALILLVVAVVLTIIFGIAFLASNKFKFYVIGFVIILVSLVYGLKLEKPNKNTRIIMILALILGAGFILIPAFGLIQTGYSTTFTPIYCNDYSFTCCIDKTDTISYSISKYGYYQCPTNANYCIVKSASSTSDATGKYLRAGSSNCNTGYHVGCNLIGNSFACSDEFLAVAGSKINPLSYFYGCGRDYTATIEVHTNSLIFTGRAGSTVGVPVPGADGCSFNPSATYKDGKLVKYETTATSYVARTNECILTFVPGDRHICGNLEEQCKVDTDCSGHTYGNKECNGRTLQTYGCRKTPLPNYLEMFGSSYAYKPFQGDNDGVEASLSRCEIISSTGVQCCGDTDCGSNAVCDISTFTCKQPAQVECNSDYDCGVSTQCDSVSKQLKTPKCVMNKCSYSTKSVSCCSTKDCPNGYFCGNDYSCKQSAVPRVDCPSECCVGENAYFDKPCAPGLFCVTNKCQSSGCKSDAECKANQVCDSGVCKDKPTSPLQCKWYESYIEKEVLQYKWYNYIGIGKPTSTMESGCYTSGLAYFLIIGAVVIIALVIIIIYVKPKKRRKKK